MKVFIRMVITIYSMLLPIVYELNAQVVDSVGANNSQSSEDSKLIWIFLLSFFVLVMFAILLGNSNEKSQNGSNSQKFRTTGKNENEYKIEYINPVQNV